MGQLSYLEKAEKNGELDRTPPGSVFFFVRSCFMPVIVFALHFFPFAPSFAAVPAYLEIDKGVFFADFSFALSFLITAPRLK